MPGPAFTVTTNFPYNVSPQTLSLVVGQTQTLTAPTGLHWITTNPNVVTLSTDDPPMLTGIAAGSATVYAGSVPISVSVYAGSLPTGTVIWSLPINGQYPSVVPAVPSSSGADVFILSGGTLSAVTADGATAWQTTTTAENAIPDFSGSAYLYHWNYLFCESSCAGGPHSVGRLDPVTHQETIIYNFSSEQDPEAGTVTNPWYSDRLGTEAVIPDTSGNLFIEDINKVVVFNSAGQQVASIPLESSTVNCPPYTVVPPPSNDPNPACPAGTAITLSPVEGKMIVAGDGNAYVPYLYANGVGHLMLLRVSPDGSYAKIVLNNALDTLVADQLARQQTHRATSPSALSVITNGDEGVVVFSPADYESTPQGQTFINAQMTYVSGDAVTARVALPITDYTYTFWPQLQREDGSYIGTIGQCIIDIDGDTALNENSWTVAAVGAGGMLWQQQFGTVQDPIPVLPLYATSDGGETVTSTERLNPEGQITPLVTLGTLYALDSGGNVTSQSTDTGAVPSWTNQWYVNPPDAISSVAQNPIDFASTWAAVVAGNQSGTSASAQQTWYPALPSCHDPKLNPPISCPGPQEAILSTLAGLRSFIAANCAQGSTCDTAVFAKLHGILQGFNTTDEAAFLNLLSRNPGLYNGNTSNMPKKYMCNWFGWNGFSLDGFRCDIFATGVNNPISQEFQPHTIDGVTYQVQAMSQMPAKSGVLIFFYPPAICTDSSQDSISFNKGLLWHESLHGFYGYGDSTIQKDLGIEQTDITNNITWYIQQNVLGETGKERQCGN